MRQRAARASASAASPLASPAAPTPTVEDRRARAPLAWLCTLEVGVVAPRHHEECDGESLRDVVWGVLCMVLYGCMIIQCCMGLYMAVWRRAPGGRRDKVSLMYGAIQLYGGLYGVPAVWHQMTR